MRKILLGLCLLGGALSLGSSPVLAQVTAGTIVLSNGGSCAYDTITTYPTGGISVTCSGGAATKPSAPNILAAVAGNNSASITFTASTSTGGSAITGYTASCAPTAGGPAILGGGLGVLTSPITVAGLANDTPYTCSVTATNAIGTSDPSGTVSVTPAAPTTRPGPPIIGAATPGDGSASIAFSPPTTGGGGITGYTASCSENGLIPFAGISVLGASPRTVTLPNGPTYLCSVTATNAIGTSDPSGTVSVVPAAVVGCGTVPVGTTVVTWSGYSNPGNSVETQTITTGTSKAYKFTANGTLYANGSQTAIETSTYTGGSNRADLTIATCPGVFTSSQATCVLANARVGSKLTTFNSSTTSECILQNGQEYYVNIRPNAAYPNVAKVLGSQRR